MSTANPQRLGRYIVTRRLGVGGMAEVFLARSRGAEGVDKSLVVKRILPDFAENPHFRTMFVDEARVAMRLNHPNLVQVYGFESDGPTLLLIMEHVDGPDLGLLLATAHRAGEKVPHAVAAHVLRELSRALHYAHERLDEQGRPLEIVHRDVSPANVLLSYEGAVKLGDFGIAHARSASFTETGLVQGKYGYMAPEQARGEPVDRRADVFALGVVLLELLLGRPWFADVPDAQTLLAQVRAGQLPDPDELVPDAPEALRAVVRRAMCPSADERYATAREVAVSLNGFLHMAEQQVDALTLEQFVEKIMPRRRASSSPASPSSRPPPPAYSSLPTVGPGSLMPDDFGAARDGVGRTMPALDPYASVTQPELMLLSDISAPRAPRVDAVGAVRERVNVAVIVGRMSRPAHSPETRALVALIDALAFKAAATLEWNGDDRFTLLVGVLRPQVDDPLRAARLALDLLDAARTLAADLESVDSALVELAPTLGLGLARGLVACAFDPDGVPMRFEPVDDALPIANGLAAAARPGEALLGAALARFVRRAFVLREAASRGPRAWALERMRGRSERDASAEVQGFGLLGREVAMGELRDAYGAVIFTELGAARRVVGELGIGKSTLLGAFAEGLLGGAAPTRVLRVEASLGTSRVPFALIAQLLHQVLVLQRDAEPLLPSDLVDREVLGRALDRAVQRWGAGTLGRRAAVRALRSCLGLDPHDESAEAAITRELALVLRPMLSETAHDGPLVLLLDGLELADAPSRALVADLARRPPGSPVLVVLALRDDDALQGELGGVPEIVVGPLDGEARRKLIAQSLGADHASDALVQEVSAVVGGNPLAMLEMVEALSERDRVRARAQLDGAGEIVADLVTDDRGEALLPGTLDEVLAARIDALPPSSRALLRWCALCEAELTRPVVDALGGPEGPRVRARLVTDGILVETPGAAEAAPVLSFAHAALRRLLRAAVDPTALPAMHARLAEVLERQGVSAVGAARHHTALAVHREAAGATRPAARAWMEAARAFTVAGARGQREATDGYERVLALCAGARDLEGLKLQAAAWEALEEAARAGVHNRRRRRALLALREVAIASQDAGVIARALTRQARFKIEITPGLDTARDVVAAVRAARRASDARTEAEARWAWSVHLGHRGELRAAIEQADAALGALRREAEVPRALEVEVLVTRSTMRRWVGEHRAALDVGAEAVATATRYGPRRMLGASYDAVGMACMASGAPAEALRFFRTAISLEREVGGRDRMARTVLHAGKAWSALGRATRALQFTQRAVSLAEAVRHGFGGTLAEALVTLAELLVERGDVDDAAAAIERARALLGAAGGRYAYVRLCLGDGRVLMARRQYRLARVAVESAEQAAAESGIPLEVLRARAGMALAAAHLGDRAAAMHAIERVLGDPLMANPARFHRGAQVLRACAEALRVLGAGRGGDVTSADAMAQQAGTLERAVMATWRVAPREATTT